ncbi:MAG: hypothetical protein ACT4OG_05350 [Alphaproteobacteria bacterium]
MLTRLGTALSLAVMIALAPQAAYSGDPGSSKPAAAEGAPSGEAAESAGGSSGSTQKPKNCLCYGDKHDGPLKDLCVIKCRCPGECGKEGSRRPAPADSE